MKFCLPFEQPRLFIFQGDDVVQQAMTEKSTKRFGFIGALVSGGADNRERAKTAEFLGEDYAAAIKVATNLSWHSRWIPYAFLANRIKKLADEIRSQTELLRVRIVELGGQVPRVSVDARELLGLDKT